MAQVIKMEPRPAKQDTIKVTLDVKGMIDQAIRFLATDPEIYQRGSELVRIVHRTPDVMMRSDGVHVNRKGEPMIVAVTRAAMFEHLCTRIRWEKTNETNNKTKTVQPPESVVRGLLDRFSWPGIKPLIAVTSSPTMRPDGTVLQTPGYDPATGIFYIASGEFPLVQELPTKDEAREAMARLKELVCDFPFESDADRSVWLTALLSLVGRHMVNGNVPGFAIDATTRGTGKTMLVELLSIIVHGQRAQTMSCPDNEEEWRKLITSLVAEGGPMMVIDNASRVIKSDALDSAITSTAWKDRRLGSSVIANAPVRGVWLFTGNNIRFGGDIPRRVLLSRLESPVERPELRTGFKRRNLVGWTQHHRASLIVDALTILRAYALTSDKPRDRKPMGSFEHWSDTIPPVLEWLGEPCPLTKVLNETEGGDEAHVELGAFLHALSFVPEGYTARDLVDAAYYDPQFAKIGTPVPPAEIQALKPLLEQITHCTPPKRPDHLKLSYWLRRVRGKIVGSLRIVGKANRIGTMVWHVQDLAPHPSANKESSTYERNEEVQGIPGSASHADESEQFRMFGEE